MTIDANEEFYKRSEDKEWRERTDGRLAALTSGETVQNDRLDEIDAELNDIHQILEGDPTDRNDNGIKGDIMDLSRQLNELRTIMSPDALGHGGFRNRLEAVEKALKLDEAGKDREVRRDEYHWKFWIAVLGFISATTLGIVTNLKDIEAFWRNHHKPSVSTEKRRPKPQRRRPVPREANAPDEEVPEVRRADDLHTR